jgi:Zn-dependent protease
MSSQEKKSRAGLWALAIKLGSKFSSVFVKLLKGAKMTKVGLAAASLAGYAAIFNWKFGLLLMIAIGFHESGHVWAMKKMGIKTKGFYFLPFIGGAAIAEENYKTYGQNSYIAIMGPIWGALMAWGSGVLYWTTGNPMWAAAGAWMATLNLFNLLPITPLDGGQLMRAIAFSIHKNLGILFLALSLLFAGFIMWKLKIGLFVLILAVGAFELFFEVRYRLRMAKVREGTLSKWELPNDHLDYDQPDGLKRYPDSMNKKQLALTVVAYAGTIAVLIVLLFLMQGVPGADLAKQFLE